MSDHTPQLRRALKVSPDFATSLGYFLISFSRCEEAVNHAIWALLKIQSHDGGLEVVSAIRDFGQRMMLLNRLSKRLLPTDVQKDELSRVLSAVTFLNDERVNLVHGEFQRAPAASDQASVFRTMAQKSSVDRRISQYSKEFLTELALYGLTTEKALATFRKNVLNGTADELPSLDKRPERHPPDAR